jgi:hypothetical protein
MVGLWNFCAGLDNFSRFQWITQFTAGPRGIISVNSVTWTARGPLSYTGGVRIKDSFGQEIYLDINAACNWNVECLSACPPNTLDCNDCCLDCGEVINKISSIRNILKNL